MIDYKEPVSNGTPPPLPPMCSWLKLGLLLLSKMGVDVIRGRGYASG